MNYITSLTAQSRMVKILSFRQVNPAAYSLVGNLSKNPLL